MKQQIAGLAQRLYTDGPWLMRTMARLRVRICPFEALIPFVEPGDSVLDVGCGSGLFLGLLAGTLESVDGCGIDSSRLAIETATLMARRAERLGFCRLRFLRVDLHQEWPSGLFDVVSMIDVLHHVSRPRQGVVFQRAMESVKPGGLLLYKDMAGGPWLPAAMNRLHDLVVARQSIHYVAVANVDVWAAESGFVRVHADAMYRWWYRHEVRVYRNQIDRA